MFVVEQYGEQVHATCTCGWQAIGRDKNTNSAKAAWSAHMYSKGYRHKADMEVEVKSGD